MKKNLRLLLCLALGWLASTSAFAQDQVEGGVYQIGDADDLIAFAGVVNGGENGANAVLTANIDMTGKEWTPIGNDNNRYIGTFDGQYFKIDNLVYTGGEKIGIFGVVNGGCVIKNLIAGPGNKITGTSMVGGIIGASDGAGWVTLENVGHEGYVEGSGNNCCAFFGVVMNSGPATRMTNCYNTGDVKAGGESAIITGWFGGHGSVEVKGFWNTGKMLSGGQNDGKDLWRNSTGITTERIFNLYDAQGATVIGEGDVASGKLAYGLNGNQDAGVWRQNLDGDNKDAQPTFDPTHQAVYANGVLQCDGITPKEGSEVTFSNQEGSSVDQHAFENGFCTVCGLWQEDFLEADEDGYFNIADGKQLNWFAYRVNVKGFGASNARLTADIDMKDLVWTPIGQDQKDYKGNFDGQGHRILNLTTSASYDNQALFGQAVGGAIIENVIIDKSCVIKGKAFTAGILGHVWGDGVIVRNCGNEADIIGSAQNSAGIVGCSEKKVYISNCYNTGSITGSNENAGICAWMGDNASTIANCWSTATGINGEALWRKSEVQGDNMYHIAGQQGEPFTLEEMANGKLAYLLNGKKSTDVAWYQKLGENGDAHPYPFGTDIVYANGALDCAGNPKEGTEVTYSNTEGATQDDHSVTDGICTVCGAADASYIAETDGAYNLASATDVKWFAALVNGGNGAANARLTADIDFKDVDFSGIGNGTTPYTGTFDGQGHIVKNMIIDLPEEANVGFFREMGNGAHIKNFTIDASCSVKGEKFAAAFVGRATGVGTALLEQLGNEGTVTTVNQNAGAIVGCNTSGELKLTLLNCYNAGTITSGTEAGGLSGWLGNDAVTKNCYNMGTVVNGESFARGNNIQITNCFDPITNWPALQPSPLADFTNGTIFEKLNTFENCYLWYLSAETGGHPVLYATEWGTDGPSPYTGIEVAEGDYFLYNVETGYWLMNNNRQTVDWNSHAEIDPIGYDFGLTAISGGWKINPYMGKNESLNSSNLYMDTEDAVTAWTFEPKQANRVSNAYTIKSGDVVLGASDDKFLQKTTKNSTWQIVTKAERLAEMQSHYSEASGDNPIDLSWLIPGGQFNIADDHAMQLDGTTGIAAGAPFVSGQTQGNGVREVWSNTEGFNISYTLSDLPEGLYYFTVSGYYRDGEVKNIGALHANGEETLRAMFYANDKEQPLMSICAPGRTSSGLGCNKQTGNYFVPDNIGDAAIAPREGLYQNKPMKVVVGEDGTLTIGVRKEGGVTDDWTILDAFRLQYFGPNNIEQYLALLQAAIDEAEAFDQSTTSGAMATALNDAISDAKEKLTAVDSDEIEAATSALEDALAAADALDVTILRQTADLAEAESLDVTAARTAIAEATESAQLDQPLYDLRAARKINALRMPDIYTGSAPAEGKVYFFNLGTGMFFGTGSDWNTHAAVDQVGIEIELIADGENFKMKTGRGGGWLSYNGYVDTGNQDVWHFLPVSGKENVYNISSTGNDGFLLGYDPNGDTHGKHYWSTIAIDRTGLDNPMNQWKVITPAEREQLIFNATADQPVDVSYLIRNASLNRQDGYDMWVRQRDGGNDALVSTLKDGNDGNRAADYAWEFYEPASFSFMQTIEGLRPGNYEVSVQGFFRNGNGDTQANVVNEGGELVQLASLVANQESVLLPNVASVMSKVPGVGDLHQCNYGEFPNMPQSSIEYFETGYYKTTVPVTVGKDGILTIGIKKDTRELMGDWTVFDNFRLVYKGGLEIETVSIVGDFTGGWPEGDDWSVAKDMTQDPEEPNFWYLEVDNFEVKLGEGETQRTYEYKASANHTWGVYEVPADGTNQDWVFGSEEYPAGIYHLLFTLNTATGELTLVPTLDPIATGIVTLNTQHPTPNTSLFNLNGQKVVKARKGLYIQNGRKVVIK